MATTDVNLYRALNVSDWPSSIKLIVDNVPATGILYPQFTPKTIGSGEDATIRGPDIAPEFDETDGKTYVSTDRGTSLFDKEFVFGRSRYWRSFTIPTGTEIPASLVVVKERHDPRRGATHYQIEAKTRMELEAFKGALDNLARNALVASVQAAKTKQEAKE